MLRQSWVLALRALMMLTWCVALHSAAGQSPASAFDEANKLFEQGRYGDAITAYQKLERTGVSSAALYFNLGNAYLKDGQTGQAIACYRLAQRLEPRDPDIRANLRFAREGVPGAARQERAWQRWVHLLTLNELAIGGALALWAWFSLLTLGQVRPDSRRSLQPYKRGFGLLLVIACIWTGMAAFERLGSSSAVVVTQEAVVRYGPFKEAQSFYTLKDGAELDVLGQKDDWFQISDASKRIGWLPRQDLVLLPKG